MPRHLQLSIPPRLSCIGGLGAAVRAVVVEYGLTELAAIQFELALVEALTNIVEHGQPPATQLLRVELRALATAVEACLCDQGRPMPAERWAEADNSVFAFDGSNLAAVPESGMGLALIKSLVDQAHYQPDTGDGKGNLLWLVKQLPVITQDNSAWPVAASAPVYRVLLVDDDRLNLRLAQALLESLGHQVIALSSGAEAVQRVRQESFDLVCMDVQMPGMDGVQATRYIRAWTVSQGQGHLPVIALTAHVQPGDRERLLMAGMDGYVSKPLDRQALQQEISLALAAAQLGEASTAFDRERALRMLGNDPQLLYELAVIYTQEAPQRVQQMRSAFLCGDALQLARLGHRLTGEAANFGRPRVAMLAERITRLARKGELQGVERLLTALEAESVRFLDDLRRRVLERKAD